MYTKADIELSRRIYPKHWRTEVGWHNIPEFLPGFGVPLPWGDAELPSWRHYTFACLNHYIPEYEVMEVSIEEHTGYRAALKRAILKRGGDPREELEGTPEDFSVRILFPSYRGYTKWFAQYDDAFKFAGEWMRAHMKGTMGIVQAAASVKAAAVVARKGTNKQDKEMKIWTKITPKIG